MGEGVSNGMEALNTALTTGLTSAANNVITSMGGVIPSAMIILGGILVVRWAIRTFKTAGK